MKKFLTLLLAAAMTLSLAACGSKTDDNSGNNSQPASALELLNAVWANYSDDDKFPAAGGDFDEANMTEDAPGNFSVEDGDALDYSLSFPAADAGKLSDAASLTHMMNANTFTAGAFHVASSSDVDSVVSDLKDNIMNRQWMCGFPDKLVILTLGDYVISCYGAEDLVDQFSEKVTEAFTDAAVVCDEAVTVGALEESIRRGAKGLLKDVSLFDIYRGPGVASGKKSVAFNLVLRADDRSLTGEEADEDVQSILAALKADHNAVLR